ncbi:glycosyltransferase family 39 protein [Patescibacteria group bacterium]|nr:glycosyltransferase family 39 protein [Patescibacteria group bacterium]
MFETAFLIGIFSYVIFSLGILNVLYKEVAIISSVAYWMIAIIFYRKRIINFARYVFNAVKNTKIRTIKKNKLYSLIIILLLFLVLLNLIGALSPETGFDALWYHLTLPKLYLQNHSIYFIPGRLLYYSAMPKLTEMLYVAALAFSGETLAKLMHFLFGILTMLVVYKISIKFLKPRYALIAVVVFYSSLVISWQSTTAYIDLARTFFESMTVLGFINWLKTGKKSWLIESGIMIGFAISTKLLAVSSVLIFVLILVYLSVIKEKVGSVFKNVLLFISCSLIAPLPWFVFSYLNTNNPIYPYLNNNFRPLLFAAFFDPTKYILEIWNLFVKAADPVSPVFLIFLPLLIINLKKGNLYEKIMFIYVAVALLIWSIIQVAGEALPEIKGGSRYFIPYLPVFSVLIAIFISKQKLGITKNISIMLVLFVLLISVGYRAIASKRYYPYLLGTETKKDFLIKNLNFSYGDFYDTDGFFADKIKKNQKALLYGFHNLYYVSFPFIDSSWAKKGDRFNYVVVQNATVPDRFKNWNLIYKNDKTYTKVYSLNEVEWIY